MNKSENKEESHIFTVDGWSTCLLLNKCLDTLPFLWEWEKRKKQS